MAIQSFQDLFNRLLLTKTPTELRAVLSEIGDYRDVGLDKPIGLGLFWTPYGGHTSNYSTIGIGSKPGRSLTERITNAMDAVLEDHSHKAPSKPHSPQAAVKEWFGRPLSTSESGLYNWNYSDGGHDRKVGVIINSSEADEAPTIDVLDYGIGIPPDKFSTTILSLHGGNKISKKYLIGAFGQGGASTLAFCDYVLIVSRHFENPNLVSFTVIKEVQLGDDYKENCFAYLAIKNGKGELTVPSFVVNDPIIIYPGSEKLRMGELKKGTLVRHYSFRLTNIFNKLSASEGNLYHYLHCSMFDPLIPFQLIDLRVGGANQQIVMGSRNRLMAKVLKKEEDEIDNSNTKLRLYRPISFIQPHGATTTCVKVEYWVVFNTKKKTDKKTGEESLSLRGDSNALFVQSRHLGVLTVNGQNQGELTVTQLMKGLDLESVARHLIIHIDSTEVTPTVRRNLFSTNREALKDGDALESIKQEIRRILSEDPELRAIENELIAKAISEVTEKTDDEVRDQIVKLLREAGFTPSAEGNVTRAGGSGESTNVLPPKPNPNPVPPPPPLPPLPTLLYPDVTRFEIVSPKEKMNIRLNGTSTILVETDADSKYENDIRVHIDPPSVEVASHFPLHGGRTRWRIRTGDDTKVGDKGKIVISLTKHSGEQLKSSIEYEVQEQMIKPSQSERGFIPDFEVLPISPERNAEKWKELWPNLSEESPEINTVAYKAQTIGSKTIVYYSTIFSQFIAMTEKLAKENVALLKVFETHYKVWIGYHAILQHNNSGSDAPDESTEQILSKEQEKERSRVAQMQVKQALESAKLSVSISKQKATASAIE